MALLNGNVIHALLSWKVYLTKLFGTAASRAAGLALGMEGTRLSPASNLRQSCLQGTPKSSHACAIRAVHAFAWTHANSLLSTSQPADMPCWLRHPCRAHDSHGSSGGIHHLPCRAQ